VLRALAGFDLRHYAFPGAVRLAVEALGREEDAIALGTILGSLGGRPREALVAEGGSLLPGLLLRLAEHDHPVVRDRAWEVLRAVPDALPDAPPGPRGLEAWRRWWLAAKPALDAEQQALLEAHAATGAQRADVPPLADGETETVQAPRFPAYEHVARLRREVVQLAIVLDDTGSMASVIAAAKQCAVGLVDQVQWYVPSFQAGVVTYKDGPYKVIGLTPDGQALRKALGRIGASGGADWEEGVDQGIALALRQEVMGWGRNAHRVLVVIGDAPPHDQDVERLLRQIVAAREDERYERPVVVHTVSTQSGGVEAFAEIARAGGGRHVTLSSAGDLERAIVSLAFAGEYEDRLGPWMEEVRWLRRHLPRERR
jgi:Mg-chelatase subunit ChlD